MSVFRIKPLLTVVSFLAITACGGGGGGGGGGTSDPSPTPNPTTSSTPDPTETATPGPTSSPMPGSTASPAPTSTPTIVPSIISGLSGAAISPSIINIFFQVSDGNGDPVAGLAEEGNDLWRDNFVVEQDGDELSVEAFPEIKPRLDLNFRIPTVIVFDISASITAGNIQLMVQGVREALIDETDPENPTSNLLPQQQVALLIFDGDVTVEQSFTKDPQVIADALTRIEMINRNVRADNNSTNLYGAVTAGLNLWQDAFTTEDVTQGYLLVATDGEDQSGLFQEVDVVNRIAGENRNVFTVSLPGASSDLANLASRPEFALGDTEFDELGTAVTSAAEDIQAILESLYVLEYVTPFRAGEHTVTIRYEDGSSNPPELTGTFNAAGFASTPAELEVIGDRNVKSGEEIDYLVNTKYTNSGTNYTWALSEVSDGTVIDSTEGNSTTLTTVVNGNYTLTVTDDRGTEDVADDLTEIVHINVTDTEVFAQTTQMDTSSSITIEASTTGENTPVFTWQVSGDESAITGSGICSIAPQVENGDAVLTSFGASGICYVHITDTANGNVGYVLPVRIGNAGTPIILTTTTNVISGDADADFEDGTTGILGTQLEWSVVTAPDGAPTSSGNFVLKANSISSDQTASASFSASFSTISFDYLVSSESSFDLFKVFIDGAEVLRASGTFNPWQLSETFTVESGFHTVLFEYSKDGSVDSGEDTAYVDNITLE